MMSPPTTRRLSSSRIGPGTLVHEFRSLFSSTIDEGIASRIQVNEVPESPKGVLALIQGGQWHDALSLIQSLLGNYPSQDTLVQLSLAQVLTYRKLRRFSQGIEILQGMKDQISFPWRILRAEAPRYQGNVDLAMKQLYVLFHEVQKDIQQHGLDLSTLKMDLNSNLKSLGELEVLADQLMISDHEMTQNLPILLRRELCVLLLLQDIHIQNHQPWVAIELLQQYTTRYATQNHWELYQQIARLYLEMGHVMHAHDFFHRVDTAIDSIQSDISFVSHMNRGLLFIADAAYESALDEFELVCEYVPENPHATNNKAICLLHLGQMAEAIEVLELYLQTYPTQSMQCDILLKNLCAMYDFYPPHIAQKKQVVVELVHAIGSDALDVANTAKKS